MNPLVSSLLVFVGGGLGANLRYWGGTLMLQRTGTAFPWPTFAINVMGSLLIGLFTAVFLKGNMHIGWRLFFSVGVLGGFTTFSSFSLEAIDLWNRSPASAVSYALGSLVLGLLACAVGLWLGQLVP